MNSLKTKTYYLIDADVLPDVFNKVIKAKELIENETAKNVTEAIKMCGLSRSAFYKYKDCVFKSKTAYENKAELQAILIDRAGVFSSFSSLLFKNGANIITMNQTAPKDGLATVSIVIGIDSLIIPLDALIGLIEQTDGIVSIKLL